MRLFTFTTWSADRDAGRSVTIDLDQIIAIEHWRRTGYTLSPCRIFLQGGLMYTTDDHGNRMLKEALEPKP